MSRHEGSSALVVNLITASATNNEKAHDRFVALENRVEEVSDEVSSIVEQQSTGEDVSVLIETLVEAASTAHSQEARTRLIALEARVEEVAGEVDGIVQQQSSGDDVSTLIETLVEAVSTTHDEEARTRFVALETRVEEVAGEVSGIVQQQSSGNDVSTLIETLVEEAISKEHTSKADFALHSAGASVLLSITSATREIWPKSMRDRLIGLTMNKGFAVGSKAEEALNPDMHAGRCWPFNGQEGQLGVALAQRIYIEEITVHHITPAAAVHDVSSAPKEMEVWGLVEGPENAEKVAKWRQSNPDDAEPKVAGNYIRLSAFSYDITIGKEAQSFPVDDVIAYLEVDFGVVLLVVTSNWGGEYTCLYRFGVHGRRLAMGSDIGSLTSTSSSASTPPPTTTSSSP